MRTDSTMLGDDAMAELRQLIARDFGAKALPDAAQVYKTKSKNAQEAHEAIRPTSAMHTPKSVAAFLNDDQRKLYELIRSEEHTSELQSLMRISYAVLCLKKK